MAVKETNLKIQSSWPLLKDKEFENYINRTCTGFTTVFQGARFTESREKCSKLTKKKMFEVTEFKFYKVVVQQLRVGVWFSQIPRSIHGRVRVMSGFV